ncbi:uncharacterized protein LOC127862402 isoform X1 [Dreissena polymorpha]|uniref:uncharacterized protein LOC127862402 isoform X1 n=1 Tax=Dreissena polymorpha TaxID=45954 RepID=UPI0022652711|nr:uncharacterized protein LOC127862402 isoform X1 [Dreissena polymorpha]
MENVNLDYIAQTTLAPNQLCRSSPLQKELQTLPRNLLLLFLQPQRRRRRQHTLRQVLSRRRIMSQSGLPQQSPLLHGESMQGVEVAVPVVAAVVIIISIVLGVLFIRRKHHKRLVASNVHSLTHLASNEVLPHCADKACKAVYENVLDERENNYTLSLPQRDSSGPGEHPYAELKGRVSSNAYGTINTELPGTSIVPKTLHSQPNLEDHEYEYIKKI